MPKSLPFPYMEIATYNMDAIIRNHMLFNSNEPRQKKVIESFHSQMEPRLSKISLKKSKN